jgi:hypothetical protein
VLCEFRFRGLNPLGKPRGLGAARRQRLHEPSTHGARLRQRHLGIANLNHRRTPGVPNPPFEDFLMTATQTVRTRFNKEKQKRTGMIDKQGP